MAPLRDFKQMWYPEFMLILAVANQKGGAGKTTTAGVLGVLLSRRGVRVHLVDMDPQANLTSALGRKDSEGLLMAAMSDRQPLPVIQVSDNLTLTPSSVDLARAETQLVSEPGRELVLRDCLRKSGLGDDVLVILDCPPSLGLLALNCLTAAQQVLVAMQPGGFELQALGRLQQTVKVLRERVNPMLEIVGVVVTNSWLRRSITQQTREEVAKFYPVLGLVRSDAELLYSTTAGRLTELRHSAALDDYEVVADRLHKALPWREKLAA